MSSSIILREKRFAKLVVQNFLKTKFQQVYLAKNGELQDKLCKMLGNLELGEINITKCFAIYIFQQKISTKKLDQNQVLYRTFLHIANILPDFSKFGQI